MQSQWQNNVNSGALPPPTQQNQSILTQQQQVIKLEIDITTLYTFLLNF